MYLPALWSKVLRDLWGNKARTALNVLSILVGVAAVGATLDARMIIERDMNEPYLATNPASATLFVSPFDHRLAAAVGAMQGVAQAEERRLEIARAGLDDGKWMDVALNVVPHFDNVQINQFAIERGSGRPGTGEVYLERKTAQALNVRVGDKLPMKWPDGNGHIFQLAVAGIVHDLHAMPLAFFEQGTGYVSMATLSWMRKQPGYNMLLIVASENRTDKQHIQRLAERARDRIIVPDGYTVGSIQLPQNSSGLPPFADSVSAVTLVLAVIGLMCILLSAGLIVNTISAQVARQVKQIGIIRSVGGHFKHILWMYLAGVLVISLAAVIPAIPLSMIGARALASMVLDMVNADIRPLTFSPFIIVIQVLIGVFIPTGAALVPILNGSRMTISQAIQQDGNVQEAVRGLVHRVMQRMQGLSIPATLAIRNIFRRKIRLSLTLFTLTLAGATFIAAFTAYQSLRGQIVDIGRYYLFDVSLTMQNDVPAHYLERELERLPGVASSEAWYRKEVDLSTSQHPDGEQITVAAVPADSATIDPQMKSGRWLAQGDRDVIVVNEDVLGDMPELAVGSEVTLRLKRDGHTVSRSFKVVGIISRHILESLVYVPYDAFTRWVGMRDDANQIRVRADLRMFLDADRQNALGDRLTQHLNDKGLKVSGYDTRYDLVVSNAGNFDILLIVLLLMAGLLALVGGMGLAGTMSLNVMERTREIGILRSTGGTNSKVRGIILVEGVFVGLISWILSVVLAVPLGGLLTTLLTVTLLGLSSESAYSLPGAAIWLMLVMGIATAASLAPANHAARLTIREVLSYE